MDRDHGCRAVLLKAWAAIHDPGQDVTEITVSIAPPLITNGWTEGYKCPHGITYYIEPTGEQRAKWRAEGVP